ncbi:hypothetical protein ARMGADRAFT_1071156 [Armillaria gallica]|uniref:Uncharacterized protein n=1 Tax=Armillaria gallica TaxID=47427 RepID=A0A2H3E5K0_ARMGA|nr:hypothetical protein ARMGADRAFT_1071156 [Armillaria gallica]
MGHACGENPSRVYGVNIHSYEAVDLDDMVRVWTEPIFVKGNSKAIDSLSSFTNDGDVKRVRSLLGISLPPTNMKKYPDFECDVDKDQLEGGSMDVTMLDGDNAPPEALPDIGGEGADKPTGRSSQWEGDAVYNDVITNY